MIKLRIYQKECIDTIRSTFLENQSQLIQLPTGAGKTIVFLNYINECRKKGCLNFLIVCPTIDLREQIKEQALNYFHSSEISSCLKHQNKNLFIITTKSLSSWTKERNFIKFDLIIFDEAHKAASNTYKEFLKRYRNFNNKFKLLGVTATPERNDKKSLIDVFGRLTFERNILDLIEEGYLSDIKAFRICTNQTISSSDVRNDEFMSTVYKMLDNPSRNNLIFKTYEENCTNKKTLIFCLSIKHCEDVAEELLRRNYKAAYIHGSMSQEKRSEILKKFKSGEITVLTNCQLLTEGFDEPSIQALIIARPTRSKSLYIQMLGRALRKYPGKEFAELYELTDNSFKICTFNVAAGGEPEDTFEYTPGTFLSKRATELLSMPDVKTVTKEFDLFDKETSDYEILSKLKPTEAQLGFLRIYKYIHLRKFNYLEAAFVIWKERLKEIYGYI